jgi:REP element-mobilizing transposase RayT
MDVQISSEDYPPAGKSNMPPEAPFALFLTWTCYGTWLPGDERGFVSNSLLSGGGFEPKANTPGTPYRRDDGFTRQVAASLQKWDSVYLTQQQAMWAAESFVRTAESKFWRILRGAVMSNHSHLVVTDCPDDGEAVRRVFKGTSQAYLSEKMGQSQKWWTSGGSDRYRHTHAAIESTIRYVAGQHGKLAEIVDNKVCPCN